MAERKATRKAKGNRQVKDVMIEDVLTIEASATLLEAAEQMGRLPVVDDGGTIIGVVTLSSLALRSPQGRETLQTAQEVSRRSARIA